MKTTKIIKIASIVIFFINISMFFLYTVIKNTEYEYCFPAINNVFLLTLFVVLFIIIPLICSIILVRVSNSQKLKMLKILILSIFSVFLLVFNYLFGYLFYSEVFSSQTDDIKNYRVFDNTVNEEIDFYGLGGFLPDKSTFESIEKYKYFYSETLLGEVYYVDVTITFANTKAYQNEIQRLLTDFGEFYTDDNKIYYRFFGMYDKNINSENLQLLSHDNYVLIDRDDSANSLNYIISHYN